MIEDEQDLPLLFLLGCGEMFHFKNVNEAKAQN
jgi:hypothetical protein